MARPLVVLALGASLTITGAPSEARADTLTLDQAVSRAVSQNAEVRAANADVLAAQARFAGARLSSQFNPELDLVSGTRSGNGTPVDLEVELWQELEVAGQRRHRRSAASSLVESQAARRDHVQARVAAETRSAFAEALAARDRTALAAEAVELAARLDEAAGRRFDAGAITVLERNLARVRLGEARRSRLAARRREADALAELKRLLAWPAEDDLGVAGSLHADVTEDLTLSDLRAHARVRRRDLSALRHARDAAAAEIRLARSEGRPNLRFGFGWQRDDGEQDVLVGVGIALPVFNRNQGGVAAGQAELERASVALAAAELAVAQDVERAWQRLLIAREDHEVFAEEVLAQVEENLDLLQESFEAGKVSLLQLLPLQHELVELRERHVEALAELAAARAELQLAAGLSDFTSVASPDATHGEEP